MKKTFLIFFITFLLTGMNNAQAQCAMCRRVAETAHSHESSKARGLNNGILYLLSIPYILGGIGVFVWYRNRNKGS